MSDSSTAPFGGTSRFQVVRQIGRGGMGIVYEALDCERNCRVALKTVPRIDARGLYLFKQEFRALADVVHPNLVALHELISVGDRWLLIMEYVEGVDFVHYVHGDPQPEPAGYDPAVLQTMSTESAPGDAHSQPLTVHTTPYLQPSQELQPLSPSTPQIWSSSALTRPMLAGASHMGSDTSGPVGHPGNWQARLKPLHRAEQFQRLRSALWQLIQGLTALHAAGKLHRDIKPSNVLVTAEGRVVVLDFGLVGEVEAHADVPGEEPEIVGTLSYMAPEQALGQPLSAASDWYSVGVMLYKTLTGSLPFASRDRRLVHDKQFIDPVPAAVAVPGLPADLARCSAGLLQRDPAARPSGAELRAWLFPGILDAAVPLAESARQAMLFIGRERELAILQDAVARTVAGQTVLVYVHGRSGVGKTRLVQHFLEGMTGCQGSVILSGRCYERESVPYKALDSLVDALCRYLRRLSAEERAGLVPPDWGALVRVFPVLRHLAPRALEADPHIPDPRELRRHAFAGLRELLTRLGGQHLLILAIDDLQWGDMDSAALLAVLLAPPGAPRLCLMCAYRSEYATSNPFLKALLETPALAGPELCRRDVMVESLSLAEAAELARGLLEQDSAETRSQAEAIARESSGGPYFVRELVHYLKHLKLRSGSLAPASVTLDEVLWRRVTELPEPARRLLEVITISARPLRQRDAFRAAGLLGADPVILNYLRIARLVRATGAGELDEIEAYHDRIREIITAQLSAETLQRHDLHLALALEAASATDPETIAIHFHGAKEHEKAGRYYRRAADEAAAALAFDRAVKLYRLSLELRPVEGAEALDLRKRLAEALANAGRCPEAAQEYQQAALLAGRLEALVLRSLAAAQYLFSGHMDEGLQEIHALLQTAGIRYPRSPRRVFAGLMLRGLWLRARGFHFRERALEELPPLAVLRCEICSTAGGGLARHDYQRALYFSVRGLQMALKLGDPGRIALMLSVVAMGLAPVGARTHRQTVKLLKRAERLARRAPTPLLEGHLAMAWGLATYMVGDYQNARRYASQAEEILRDRCIGAIFPLSANRIHWHWSLLFLGELTELRRLTAVQVHDAEERGDWSFTALAQAFALPFLHLADDEPERARQAVRESLVHRSMRDSHALRMLPVLSQIAIELYECRDATPWSYLSSQWRAWQHSDAARGQSARIEMHFSRARCALAAAGHAAQPRLLYQVAAREARWLECEKAPRTGPLAGLIRAALAAVDGQQARAIQILKTCVTGFEREAMGLHAAAARRRLGQLTGSKEGQILIDEADAWMSRQTVRQPSRMTQMLAPGFPVFPTCPG